MQNRREIMKIHKLIPGHFTREIITDNHLNTAKGGY